MLIRERIDETKFSPSEQIIVNYILAHLDELETLSTTKIANDTYSSKSTIVNIAKKLNFTGWSDFKRSFQKEILYYKQIDQKIDANYPFTKYDNALQISQKIAEIKIQAINETASLNDFAILKQAMSLLADSTHIHLFGLANNLLISQEFIYNLRRINRYADIHSLEGSGMMAATMARKGECAIIVSYSGETKKLVHIAEILLKKTIPIILITNIGESSLSRMAHCVLRISTREKLYSKISNFSTDAAITYVLDTLYGLIFSLDYDHNLNIRRNSSKIMETSRQTHSNILKET